MDYQNNVLELIKRFRKHPKWHSFYLKTSTEILSIFNLPTEEIIETTLEDLAVNEDFCIPLIVSKEYQLYPSLDECFKLTVQNQIVAILYMNQQNHIQQLSVCYLHRNELTHLEIFTL